MAESEQTDRQTDVAPRLHVTGSSQVDFQAQWDDLLG